MRSCRGRDRDRRESPHAARLGVVGLFERVQRLDLMGFVAIERKLQAGERAVDAGACRCCGQPDAVERRTRFSRASRSGGGTKITGVVDGRGLWHRLRQQDGRAWARRRLDRAGRRGIGDGGESRRAGLKRRLAARDLFELALDLFLIEQCGSPACRPGRADRRSDPRRRIASAPAARAGASARHRGTRNRWR